MYIQVSILNLYHTTFIDLEEKAFENTVGKGENAGNLFLFFIVKTSDIDV